MTADKEGARRLDRYLAELKRLLHPLPDGEIADIVAELHSHVLDSTADAGTSDDAVANTLQRLGAPDDLASSYVTNSSLRRASHSHSPWLVLRSILHWARFSINGFVVLLMVLAGYTIAISFAIAAMVKLFAPSRTGLWSLPDGEISLHLGFGSAAPQGLELLGYWIVPLGLLTGTACVLLTMHLGRWCIHRFLTKSPISGIGHGLKGRQT